MNDFHFPNAELHWHAEHPKPDVERVEIESRIDAADEAIVPLSGGLANDTFRVGRNRVLRIYRRDVRALLREQELLQRHWTSFRVPKILDAGDDWLLLEFVEHRRLQNTPDNGSAVGRALAEIHQTRFDACGLFGDTLQIVEPWPDFPAAIEQFVHARCDDAPDPFQPTLERCLDWIANKKSLLRQHCEESVLLHGDFKPSNVHGTTHGELSILDWEFTYAGPPLMDIGQLVRWGIPESFRSIFFESYTSSAELPNDWEQIARCFDLVNLVGLLAKSLPASRRARDCIRAIEITIDDL